MKLMEIFELNEEQIIASLKNGGQTKVYKNPSMQELNKISLNGIVKGILTPQNFIAYDFQNINLRELPTINGVPVTIYLQHDSDIVIELMPFFDITEDDFKNLIDSNLYLKKFNIKEILVKNHEIE